MARIRTIKPDFFRSKTINRLSADERLTFVGLWCHVDDEGRCEVDLDLIKADIWPRSRTLDDVLADLVALEREALIVHYVLPEPSGSAPGVLRERSWICVNGFREHQAISKRRPSKIPAPSEGRITPLTSVFVDFPESSRNVPGAFRETSATVPPPFREDSSRERKGKEGKGREVPPSAVARAERTDAREATPDTITAQTVTAAWIDRARSNGFDPPQTLIGQVARAAKQLLDGANDPQRVLDAACRAAAKGFATIDRELLRSTADPDADRRDPRTGRIVDWAR